MALDMKMAAKFAASKVLVVDDEFYMRKVVHTLLMSIGIGTVYEAPDGQAGLELIHQTAPDVVIVDWQMPGLNGPGFVRTVRSSANVSDPHVPIIMLTGHSERARVLEAIEIGVNDFLLKPVSAAALEERLVSVLTDPRPAMKPGSAPDMRRLMPGIHADNDRTLAVLD